MHFVEAEPLDVDPTIRRVADQALREACADLHLDGVRLRWFVPRDAEGPVGTITRLLRELSGDEASADEPASWGDTFDKWGGVLWLSDPSTTWLNAKMPLAEVRRVVRHECKHVHQTRHHTVPRTAREREAVEADAERFARAVSPGLGG